MSLRYAILGLLSYKPMTGYNLKKMFDESISNFWAASLSQIYRELGILESKGYLTSVIEQQNDKPDKRIYSVTETGKAAFKEWITKFPQKLSKGSRDEFTLRIFFGSNLSKEELIMQFQNFIKEKQDQMAKIKGLYRMSGKYVEEMELFNEKQIYWRFVLRRAYLSIEMLIQWANECLDELHEKLSHH